MRLVYLCLPLLAVSVAGQGVVINEVNTSTAAWIEIRNSGAAAQDVSGWSTEGFWDNSNPGVTTWNFVFPGVPGSSTTVLGPGQFAVIGESALFPTVPAGVLRFTHAAAVPWSSGVSGSLRLVNQSGQFVDAVLWSNSNLDQAGAIVAGHWSGFAEPVYLDLTGGTPIPRPATTAHNANFRHSSLDSGTGLDWTNFGTNGTPGVLNPFQAAAPAAGTPPTASFITSIFCGVAPLTVTFTNTSLGEVSLASVTWDFDATGTPGVQTAGTHHAARTLGATAAITLTLLDGNGNMSVAGPTIVTVSNAPTVTPVSACFSENFESVPPLVADPCGGAPTFAPSTGFEYRAVESGARFRVVNGQTLSALTYNWPLISAAAGPTAVILDSTSNVTNATNKLIVHLNGLVINAGNGFRVRYWLQENNDEVNLQDYVALSDGVTPGPSTSNNGATGTGPGLDGFREAHLLDWNSPAININRVWVQFTHSITPAFLAANGMVMSSDMRFIISQADNATFEGTDGLAIDVLEVLPLTPTAAGGQPGIDGFSLLDINAAVNANCSYVGDLVDPNGPHFAVASVGTPMTFVFDGPPNQPIVLIAGALNPGVYSIPVPGAGQIDVGASNPLPPFLPSFIIVIDGTQPNFFNSLFTTGPTGRQVFSIGTPFYPPGVISTFQAAIFNGTTIIGMSNAVQLAIE